MWTLAWLPWAAATVPVLVEPDNLKLKERVSAPFDYDPHSPPGRCIVRVHVDEQGAPLEADARGCEDKYAAGAVEAAMGLHWSAPHGSRNCALDGPWHSHAPTNARSVEPCPHECTILHPRPQTATGRTR